MESKINKFIMINLLSLGVARCTNNAPKDPPILSPAPAVQQDAQATNGSSPEPFTAPNPAKQRSFLLVTSRDEIARLITPSALTALLADADQAKIVVTSDPKVLEWETTLGSLKEASEQKWSVKIPESSVAINLTAKIISRDQKEILTAAVVINPGPQEESLRLSWKQAPGIGGIPSSPQPTPTPPTSPAPTSPAPAVVPSTLNQWDGQSDLGGVLWTIQTAP